MCTHGIRVSGGWTALNCRHCCNDGLERFDPQPCYWAYCSNALHCSSTSAVDWTVGQIWGDRESLHGLHWRFALECHGVCQVLVKIQLRPPQRPFRAYSAP